MNGVVREVLGPVTYSVEVKGKCVKRHVNQILGVTGNPNHSTQMDSCDSYTLMISMWTLIRQIILNHRLRKNDLWNHPTSGGTEHSSCERQMSFLKTELVNQMQIG